MDYRNLNEKFDRIVSVGMFEHVGSHNYSDCFKVINRCMKDDAIFLLHTIGVNLKHMPRSDPFVHRYIFPNGSLPYCEDITKETFGRLFLEDWHSFGPDYAKTLKAWNANFVRNYETIKQKYDDRFFRMWTFYLNGSAGLFQSRQLNLWQMVFSKNGLDEYRAVR